MEDLDQASARREGGDAQLDLAGGGGALLGLLVDPGRLPGALVLPVRRAGILVVRSRPFDTVAYIGLGVLVITFGVLLPN